MDGIEKSSPSPGLDPDKDPHVDPGFNPDPDEKRDPYLVQDPAIVIRIRITIQIQILILIVGRIAGPDYHPDRDVIFRAPVFTTLILIEVYKTFGVCLMSIL